jgi:hypothetical protein
MLCHVALVRTDVSEELSASFIRVTRIGELGTTLVLTSVVPSSSILVTLMKEAQSSSETSVLTRATRRNITEDDILLIHRREYLKSYIVTTMFQRVPFPSLLPGKMIEIFYPRSPPAEWSVSCNPAPRFLFSAFVCVSRSPLISQTNKLRGPWSASELYRLGDRHFSTKFSANFCR